MATNGKRSPIRMALATNAGLLVVYFFVRKWVSTTYQAHDANSVVVLEEVLFWIFVVAALVATWAWIIGDWIRRRKHSRDTSLSHESKLPPVTEGHISPGVLRKTLLLAVLGLLATPIVVLAVSQLLGNLQLASLLVPLVVLAIVICFALFANMDSKKPARFVVSVALLALLGAGVWNSVNLLLQQGSMDERHATEYPFSIAYLFIPVVLAALRLISARIR